jgi:unsaturated rhamnogalacturonyl hydrolase
MAMQPAPRFGDQPLSLAAAAAIFARRSPDSFRWRYEDGLALLALAAAGRAFSRPAFLAFVRKAVEGMIDPSGEIAGYHLEDWNLDQVNPGKLLFDLRDSTGDPRYAAAIKALRAQLEGQPRGPSGCYWHKGIYPNQVWLDGFYMVAPFRLRSCLETGDIAGIRDLLAQFSLAAERCRDPSTGLLHHAWDESRSEAWADSVSGRSPHAWGRAMGWFAMALVDCLGLLPLHHEGHSSLKALLGPFADAVAGHADPETGLWWQLVDRAGEPGNYLETSASSMFVYAFMRGVSLGALDGRFRGLAGKAWDSLASRYVHAGPDGALSLGGICQVAGLGGVPYRDGSARYYYSEPVVEDDFKGLGPFILAGLEVEAVVSAGKEGA